MYEAGNGRFIQELVIDLKPFIDYSVILLLILNIIFMFITQYLLEQYSSEHGKY